jgi:hypothetical protein
VPQVRVRFWDANLGFTVLESETGGRPLDKSEGDLLLFSEGEAGASHEVTSNFPFGPTIRARS